MVFGNWDSETGSGIRKLESGIRKLESGIRKLDSGIRKLETLYSETGSCTPKLESDIRKLGVVFGNDYSETGTLELENFRDTATEC